MKNSALIHLGIAILVAILAVIAYVWWQEQVLQAVSAARTLAEEASSVSGTQAETLRSKTELSTLTADEAFVEERFLPPSGIVEFLEGLEETGRSYEAEVSVVSVSDVLDGDRIAIALSVEGSFDAVMRTLGTLEYGPRAVTVETVTLDTSGEGAWTLAGRFLVGAARTP